MGFHDACYTMFKVGHVLGSSIMWRNGLAGAGKKKNKYITPQKKIEVKLRRRQNKRWEYYKT